MTPVELEPYLEAIRRYQPAHAKVTAADVLWFDTEAEHWLYVNDPPRDSVLDGEIYVTFIVKVSRDTGEITRVVHYRSRRGAHGDETLP